jgi:hypothetical protein
MLADLPDWDWYDISAHLKCTACGKVGWVDTRLYWSEVIDFTRGFSDSQKPSRTVVSPAWPDCLSPVR